jgi:hypothetical protein
MIFITVRHYTRKGLSVEAISLKASDEPAAEYGRTVDRETTEKQIK